MKKFLKGFICVLLFVIVGITSFALVREYLDDKEEVDDFELRDSLPLDLTEETQNEYTEDDEQQDKKEYTISDVVDNVMPSIVTITSKGTYTTGDFFFGQQEAQYVQAGSGIIISYNDQSVMIITNYHVVENSDEIRVTFFDDSIVRGKIKGSDKSSDLAIISVNVNDMPLETVHKIRVASLGSTQNLRVGETVIAVGNAMGDGNSVTIGILSAKDRELELTDNASMKLLQTDAAINPGNSGGALLNLRGEVIGINSIKYVSTYAERVGYAIPIDTAVPIINEIINYEEINKEDRGYMGITGKDVTDEFAKRNNAPYGVYVYEVGEDSPAQKAGILEGDIIVAINGRRITSMEAVSDMLKYKRVGDICKLTIHRFEQGRYVEYIIEVELGKSL